MKFCAYFTKYFRIKYTKFTQYAFRFHISVVHCVGFTFFRTQCILKLAVIQDNHGREIYLFVLPCIIFHSEKILFSHWQVKEIYYQSTNWIKISKIYKWFTFGTTYTHHSLEANLACKITVQRQLKVLSFGRVWDAVKVREVVHCSTWVLWYTSYQNMHMSNISSCTSTNNDRSRQVAHSNQHYYDKYEQYGYGLCSQSLALEGDTNSG